jgi:hypothetical protein
VNYTKYLLVLFSVGFVNLQAQQVQISYIGGQVKKHKEGLFYTTPAYTSGVELSIFKKPNKKSRWENYWGHPDIELSAYGIRFGDDDVLGYAIGVLPAVDFKARKGKKLQLRFSIGGGLAYLNKKYDYAENPLNNAIGSHFNNGTRLGFGITYLNLSLMGNLYHFSNGSSATPNSGINVIAAKLAYRFHLKTPKEDIIEYKRKLDEIKPYKKWGLDIMGVRGFNQFNVDGGPTYGIYSLSLGGYKAFGPFVRLHMGLEYEYNETLYKFFINDFHTEKEARGYAYNSIGYIGAEMFLGRIGLKGKLGFYLPYPTIEKGDPLYIKLESHYYPLGQNAKISPYIGVALKSHYAVAQYIAIQGGVNF